MKTQKETSYKNLQVLNPCQIEEISAGIIWSGGVTVTGGNDGRGVGVGVEGTIHGL